MCDSSDDSTDCPLSSAMTSWNRRNLSYGTPPPCLKHSTMSSSTDPMTATYCANTAMLSATAARVRKAACSAGSVKRLVAGSSVTTRAVTIAPSHSRTYRSLSSALDASSSEVAGGDLAHDVEETRTMTH